MARLLTQTLTLARPASSPSTTAASVSLRGLATKVEIIEIDLTEEDASSSAHGSSPSSPSVEVVGIRRLEEAIHGVMVRRAAPDWLPFVPGGSFWVPPLRRPHGVAELVGRIAAAGGSDGVAELVGGIAAAEGTEGVAGAVGGAVEVVELDAPMTEEQALCFSTTRGWPSSSFFVEGKSPNSRRKSMKGATQTDDEESWFVYAMLQGAPTRKRSAEFDDSAMINVHMDGKEPIAGKPWHPLQLMLPHPSWKINL